MDYTDYIPLGVRMKGQVGEASQMLNVILEKDQQGTDFILFSVYNTNFSRSLLLNISIQMQQNKAAVRVKRAEQHSVVRLRQF